MPVINQTVTKTRSQECCVLMIIPPQIYILIQLQTSKTHLEIYICYDLVNNQLSTIKANYNWLFGRQFAK